MKELFCQISNMDIVGTILTPCMLMPFENKSVHNSTLSQTSPGFNVCTVESFENTVENEDIARKEQFLLFPQPFQPVWRSFFHFQQI